MNKELIKKYKKEFEHWLNGGELLYSYIDDKLLWKNIDEIDKNIYPIYRRNPFQISEYHIIIINDEYVEFRKALVEGKVVQEQDYYTKEWIDMKNDNFHGASDTQYEGVYRIKPEEPKFKIGDFVVVENEIGHIYTIDKETKMICVHGKPSISGWYNPNELELWEPKQGEWCWFHNGTSSSLVFAMFYNSNNFGYWINEDETEVITNSKFLNYRICEPFTGKLPNILTSNQMECINE